MSKDISDTFDKAKPDGLIHLSSGVVLVAKQANPVALITVMTDHKRPKPPEVFIEVMGRKIENTEDPDYIERVKAWEREHSSAILDALILLGTELKDKPKGFPGPDDNAWMDEYLVLNLQAKPESKAWRYLTWVKFKAVQNTDDLGAIKDAVGTLSGVREADVKDAEAFPGRN